MTHGVDAHRVSSLVGRLSLIKVGTWCWVGGRDSEGVAGVGMLLPLPAEVEKGEPAGVDWVNRCALALYGDLPDLGVLGVVEVELGRSDMVVACYMSS